MTVCDVVLVLPVDTANVYCICVSVSAVPVSGTAAATATAAGSANTQQTDRQAVKTARRSSAHGGTAAAVHQTSATDVTTSRHDDAPSPTSSDLRSN